VELADKPITLVKLSIVPSELPDSEISAVLSEYGVVKTIRDEYYDSQHRYEVTTILKLIYMQLEKAIPSFIEIQKQRYLVTYFGHERTCFACNQSGHQYESCAVRKKKSQSKDHKGKQNISGVATEPNVPIQHQILISGENTIYINSDSEFPNLLNTVKSSQIDKEEKKVYRKMETPSSLSPLK